MGYRCKCDPLERDSYEGLVDHDPSECPLCGMPFVAPRPYGLIVFGVVAAVALGLVHLVSVLREHLANP